MTDETKNLTTSEEIINAGGHLVIVRGWDSSVESLRSRIDLEQLIQEMGFNLETLVGILTKESPENMQFVVIPNSAGDKMEDLGTENLTVDGQPLEKMFVIAYPPVANPFPTEMTRFMVGGEVILMTAGEAEITYAGEITDGFIPRSSLISERVKKGDLIISTDAPNNWTGLTGDSFSFTYVVGNPKGPRRYNDIPKENVPIR